MSSPAKIVTNPSSKQVLEEGEISQSEPSARGEEIVEDKQKSNPLVMNNSSEKKDVQQASHSKALIEKDVKKEAELKAQAERESEAQVHVPIDAEKEKALMPPLIENQEKSEEPLTKKAKMNVDQILGTSIPEEIATQSE